MRLSTLLLLTGCAMALSACVHKKKHVSDRDIVTSQQIAVPVTPVAIRTISSE